MNHLKRIINIVLLYMLMNYIFVFYMKSGSLFLKIIILLALIIYYIYFNIIPRSDKINNDRLKIMIGGYDLILISGLCLFFESILYIIIALNNANDTLLVLLIVNGLLSLILLSITFINGYIRIYTTSRELGIVLRIFTLLFWWVPILNFIFIFKSCSIIKREFDYEIIKYNRNERRKDIKVCKTKYPIILVHGIFFRDFKMFNYWGRIPKELELNGADIYYGNQQSSLSVEDSALELKKRIDQVLFESGAKKVNIIAHSKGGLDARYAISMLDMSKKVASLTTINTPHYGCNFAKESLDKVPQKLVNRVVKWYNTIFTKLGDEKPDFYRGIKDLTPEKCEKLNKILKNKRNILYQSVGSILNNSKSTMFPLNISYKIIKTIDGNNDGLVYEESMKWGNYLGTILTHSSKGVSHGDMIDLTRKNIIDFDVCEYYVNLVKDLKDKEL